MLRLCVVALIVNVMLASLQAADLTGKVTNRAGEPLAGVRVDISTAGPKVGRGVSCPSCYLDCRKRAKTDAEGKFTIAAVDPTLKFHLLASAPGKKTTQTDWVDPAAGATIIRMDDFPDVDSSRVVRGKVVSEQGVPVAGALISPSGAKQPGRRWVGQVNGAEPAVSDEFGQFQVLLSEDYLGIDVEVQADGSPGLLAQLLAPGDRVHELTIPAGTKVTGQLTVAGKPAADQPVAVVQLYRGSDELFIAAVLATSDAKGNFVFEHLPADQPYVIFTPRGVPSTGLSLPTKLFAAKGNGETRDLGGLELQAGSVLAGKILPAAGQSLPAGIKLTAGREPAWDLIEIEVDAEGRFRIENLPPETYALSVSAAEHLLDERQVKYHLLREQSLAVRLGQDVSGIEIPLRVLRADEPRLERGYDSKPLAAGSQTLSGMVVDRAGKPVAGIRVTAEATGLLGARMTTRPVQTSTSGTFTLTNLPDRPLSLSFANPKVRGNAVSKTSVSVPYPGYVRTGLNQADVRFVFDPEIYGELEDLK